MYNATTGVDSKDSYNYLDSDVHEEVNDTLVTENEKGKSLNGVFRVRDRQMTEVAGYWDSKKQSFYHYQTETGQCYMKIRVQCS